VGTVINLESDAIPGKLPGKVLQTNAFWSANAESHPAMMPLGKENALFALHEMLVSNLG
jgi:hypothetical protein